LSGVLEKLVALLPLLSSSTSRSQRSAGSRPLESRDDDDEEPPPLLGLLFNLATFDGGNRRRLVAAGLVQAIASAIDRSPMALALLYQMLLLN
jgi:hypothetical protein